VIHSKFQPHSKTIKQAERKERMEVEKRISMSLQQTQGQDNKLTSTFSSKKRRKI